MLLRILIDKYYYDHSDEDTQNVVIATAIKEAIFNKLRSEPHKKYCTIYDDGIIPNCYKVGINIEIDGITNGRILE